MGQRNVPVKTSEGAQEIKARTLGLAPRIRTALLLVDGVKSVAELERLMTAAGVTTGALQLLLDKGLIRFQEEEPEKAVIAAPSSPLDSTAASVATVETADVESLVGPVTDEIAATLLLADAFPEPVPGLHEHPEEKSKELFVEASPLPSAPPAGVVAVPAVVPDRAPELVPMLPPITVVPAVSPAKSPARAAPAALEVVTLLELETILGEATKLEMETILGVATKLEVTPTQMLAPNTAVKVPPTEPHLPPLAQAEQEYRAAATVQKLVIPAAVLRMNLTVARAHLANALDLFLEIDGYALKQKVMACESRADLEQLFRVVEGALMQKMDKSKAARVMGIAQSLLER